MKLPAKVEVYIDILCLIAQPKEGQQQIKKKQKQKQNCQKIELYGSPTIKELEKKHSFRLVGGVEMGSWGGEDARQGSGRGPGGPGGSWWTKQSHISIWIMQKEQVGRETDNTTQGSNKGKLKPQTSGCKNLWGLQQWGRNSQPHSRVN